MPPKNRPLITIGITCHNAALTIKRSIASALKQDWSNFEIIIVDDFSEDNSIEIIEEMKEGGNSINLICHAENKGYPAALNTIINHASGEYIAFFDDDDDNRVDRLSEQYERLSKFENSHPGHPVLCYSHRRVFVDGNEKSSAFVHAIGALSPEPHGFMVADFLLLHKKNRVHQWGEFGSCTMMASRKLLREFGFDERFRRCAEWDLAVRVALQGGYFISVDKPLVLQHKTNSPDKSGRKPLIYSLMLRKKHKEYLSRSRAYWGSIFQSYSRFYYFKKRPWKSRICLALACFCSPSQIMVHEIAKRLLNDGKGN